ncbi:uncharacterized protein BDR25DRAFT_300187 [Lindgomyces ingoldianus]|uniref:Uncharacterized protein n=1 Tax=Lindgomyces ingoldianus TaxID=673940 RepID=A0ACB6RD05_9PLEO|nr:uncharacterized protein BDR25DRAFT_300187 [Lindgomyces ingoldianus]KAF2477163.1 hypothetical protein BDR25DRAFT_300187 [Lindgomyces ingoldianus]
MAGIRHAPSGAGATSIAGLKRAHAGDADPSCGLHAKKRRVVHRLQHLQPTQNIVETLNAECDTTGQHKDFFTQQLKRGIAIELKAVGFDSARPEAMERMYGLVDNFMTDFLARVRKSMASARRTSTIPHDWIYALTSLDITRSSTLALHLDSGELPPPFLQPGFAPPEPAEPPPPDLEGLIGPELSGKAEKETRKWIPKHFPPFPSKHTWKATPVFTERENDPRKIREKATEEGIQAEQSLRKLMAAQKAGLQKKSATEQRRATTRKKSDALWQDAMKSLLEEEEKRDAAYREDEDEDCIGLEMRPRPRNEVNLEEGVHANYDQRYWRKAAREVKSGF